MSTLLNKCYLVKVSTKEEGVKNTPNFVHDPISIIYAMGRMDEFDFGGITHETVEIFFVVVIPSVHLFRYCKN